MYALVVNWNSAGDTISCVHSIKSSERLTRVIILDNASAKDDYKRLSDVFSDSDVVLLRSDENLGYAGGNNFIFKYLKKNDFNPEHLIVINPDVTADAFLIDVIDQALDAVPNAGLIGCGVDTDGTLRYSDIQLKGLFQQRIKEKGLGLVESKGYVPGCFLAISKSFWRERELFDENYFMYWEEVDLNFKSKGKGLVNLMLRDHSVIRNDNSTFLNMRAVYYYVRNSFLLRSKYPYDVSRLDMLLFIFFTFFSQLNYSVRQRRVKYIANYFLGLRDGVLCNWGRKW